MWVFLSIAVWWRHHHQHLRIVRKQNGIWSWVVLILSYSRFCFVFFFLINCNSSRKLFVVVVVVVVGHINLFSRAMYSAQVGQRTPAEGVLMHTLCSYCFVLENGEKWERYCTLLFTCCCRWPDGILKCFFRFYHHPPARDVVQSTFFLKRSRPGHEFSPPESLSCVWF